MITGRRILWASAAVFLLTLVANIPAALLYAAFRPESGPLVVHGLQGPWAAGQLSGISLNNRMVARELRWTVKPWWLPLGRLALDVEGGGDLAAVQGGVALTPRSLRLDQFRLASSVKRLAGLANLAYLPLDGQAGLRIDRLVLRKGFVDYLAGRVDLQGLAWTLGREPLALGDFAVELSTTPEAVVAAISSPSGPLEAGGEARLFPDRRWEADIRLRAKPEAPEALRNTLRNLGAADPQGFHHLKQKGQLR